MQGTCSAVSWHGPSPEFATSPFQYALSTRAGCGECVAHVLQGICELDPTITIMSIDGISAFDFVSRRAMLSGFHRSEMQSRIAFRLFVSSALVNGCSRATMTLCPHRTELLQHELFTHAGIRVHGGKTQVWNMIGIRQGACDVLEQIAQAADPTGSVWRGSDVPSVQQGIKILGAPLGHPDFVSAYLERTIAEHAVLLERIPLVRDVQSAWLLLVHCAQVRATYLLRSLQPSLSEEFARCHDAGMWGCLLNSTVPGRSMRRRGPSHSCSASGLGRSRASQCRAHKVRRFLGELGRLLAHGVCSTP